MAGSVTTPLSTPAPANGTTTANGTTIDSKIYLKVDLGISHFLVKAKTKTENFGKRRILSSTKDQRV